MPSGPMHTTYQTIVLLKSMGLFALCSALCISSVQLQEPRLYLRQASTFSSLCIRHYFNQCLSGGPKKRTRRQGLLRFDPSSDTECVSSSEQFSSLYLSWIPEA